MNSKNYDCSDCNYRDKTINFCGFCTKRLLEEMREAKNERKINNAATKNKSDE